MQVGAIATSLYRDSRGLTINSIGLTDEIDALIDNKMYRNKFRKLIREGQLHNLQTLAAIARTKRTPSRWFAVVTAKARWEGTLQWLRRLQRVARNAADIVKRLAVPDSGMKAVYKACWQLDDTAVRHAVTAAETGRDQFRYFNWLCSPKRLRH